MKMPVILIILLLIFCGPAFADMIYMNDSTSFEGRIIGIEGNRIRIKTSYDIFMVDKDKIKKVKWDQEEDRKIDERYPTGPGTRNWDFNWE